MKASAAIILVCGAAVVAYAGPTHPTGKRTRTDPIRPLGGGNTDSLPFSDNFDSYANGSALAGQGTWVRWDPALSIDGVVSNAFSATSPNAFKYVPQSDQVQTGPSITAGRWELTCMTYFPSTTNTPGVNDGAFIIGMNRFTSGGPCATCNDWWSAQIQFGPSNQVRNYDLQTQNTPLITNAWVPFRMVIDLTADKWDAYYNCTQFITQRSWSQGVSTPGQVSIGGFDFYGGNLATTLPFEFYVDNVVFRQIDNCYANCDQSTATPILNANDFQCFLNAFAGGTCYANCDASTAPPTLNANDFQCFLNAYATGCS